MNTKTQRVSDKLIRDLRKTGIKLVDKGIVSPYNRNEISMRALTERIAKTPSWKKAQQELYEQMRKSKR